MRRLPPVSTVVVGLTCVGAGLVIAGYLHRYGLAGLAVDRAAVRAWLGGDGLYAYRSSVLRVGIAEPPVAAMLLVALAGLPLAAAGWLLALIGVLALVLTSTVLVGPLARRYRKPRWPAVLLVSALALTVEPVRASLGLGRLNLLLFGLIIGDVVALRRARRPVPNRPGGYRRPAPTLSRPDARLDPAPTLGRPGARLGPASAGAVRGRWRAGAWAGVGTGIATALAVGPVLFLGYFALTRQWRALLVALGTAAALTVGALLVAPGTSAAWLSAVLLRVDRSGPVGMVTNQSLAGVLTRLYHSANIPVLIWLSFAALLLAVGLIRARAAHADGDELAAFTLVGLAGAGTAPVTQPHELMWVLPAVLILADAALWRRATARFPRAGRFPGIGWAAAAIVVYLLFALPPEWTVGWNAYALVVIVLLNALPWHPAGTHMRAAHRVPAIPGPRGS